MVKISLARFFIASVLLAGLPAAAGACLHPSVPLPASSDAGNVENGGLCVGLSPMAEHIDTLKLEEAVVAADTLAPIADGVRAAAAAHPTAVDTARLRNVNDSILNATAKMRKKVRPKFVPDPKRALWLSLVFPGAGQIYNRKYWKLPFIYGGFLGCTYAFKWNQQMYRDYSQAYLDIMDDDPNTNSYLDMLPPRYDITGREDRFKNIFKRKKDYYRRYRDLSAFCFIGVYILSVIDAYVDAQLSVFDISPDLSMRLEPAVINNGNGLPGQTPSSYGIGCNLSF